jgi:hypothetical protein
MTAIEAPTEPATDLRPVRVRVRQLDYVTRGLNPLGDEVDKIATAYGPSAPQNDPANHPGLDPESQEAADLASDFRYGQLIMVRPLALAGLIESGAVRTIETDDETGEEVVEDEQLLDVNTASVDDLADWIKDEHPTVNDVVQASDGDAEVARKLLEAESRATDGEPRRGVVTGLTAVVSRG